MRTLYMIWMILGVIGFPASVGWFLHRWQKYARAQTDNEKVEQREKVRKAGVFILVTLLLLLGFFLFTAYGGGKDLM